ncbi:MAG TPA: ribonuclease P protein component [Gammaproteobacteria bacterium]|nr:ribonuclease P protein component [Gammaproteobacteria bacterium]
MNAPDNRFTFPKSVRLSSSNDYGRVFKKPLKSKDKCFTLLVTTNNTDVSRLGLAISKKAVNKAVDRNRVKRLVRDSFRHSRHALAGIDIVVLANRGLGDRSNKEMLTSLSNHWKQLVKKCAPS